ncbi:hypothetical protein GUJ93_ZPchr0012g21955 [Zizania palustris]|uniref:Membrane insertase YidC/Oxa/ALB C-terminal domain-containing protein n=1 Tax=Zizania palustris TaxID=103762 RepID=A0A8J5WPA5_ZIZPA|nr:hypothetical protein GUJ93_ZPchr0012g21955 [Zizania palustris]
MAFAARRGLASRLSHHLTRRLHHPATPHLIASHSSDESPNPSSPPPPPPQLPPFHSPLPRRSRTGQILNHLHPFSLMHLSGPQRRSFSSASPAPDASTPAGEVDAAAGVLADAAAAPFPGEVAAAAADSFFPVAALQHLIDAIHTFTGLNWWACIALTTVLIRCATVPLLLNQLKVTAKLNALKPEMEAIKDEMNAGDPKSSKEGKYKMTALFQKHGVSPLSPLKGLLIQGPIFMSFFFAIRNMVEKVPSFKGGGTLWFTDLTTSDTLYIFPVLTGLTFLLTVELNVQQGMEGNPMASSKMKNFSRAMALMTVPFTMEFSKGIFCYWITSNLFSLTYGIVIRRPAVSKYFSLPSFAQPASAKKQILNLFGGSKAIPAAESPAAITGAPRSSLEQPDATALGYRVKNLEKKVKSRGKSRKRR